MNIDSNFMQNVRVRAMRAECGSAGVLALIELMCEMFESPEGYWMWWQKMDRVAFASRSGITLKELDAIIDRMAEYNIVDEHLLRTQSILTSKFIQSEFIRQCGTRRACRLLWDRYVMLNDRELLELGVIPARRRIENEPEEPLGEPQPIDESKGLMRVRVKSSDPELKIYKLVKKKRAATGSAAHKRKQQAAFEGGGAHYST